MRNYYFISFFIFVMQAGAPLSMADDQNKMQGTFGEPWAFGTELTVNAKKQKADPLIPGILFRGASLGGKSDDGPVFYTSPDLFSVSSGLQMTIMPIPKFNAGESTKSYLKRFKDSLCDKGRPKVRAVERVSYKTPKVAVGTSVEEANKFQRETLKRVRNYLAESELFRKAGKVTGPQMYFSQRVTEKKVTLAMQGFNEDSLSNLAKFFSNERWATTTDFGDRTPMMLLSVADSKSKEKTIVPSINPITFDMAVIKRDHSSNVISGKASLEDTLEPIDKSWRISDGHGALNPHALSGTSPPLTTCTKCGQQKVENDFHQNKNKKNGRDSHCRECISTKKAEIYQGKKQRRQEQEKRRKKTNVLDIGQFEIVEKYLPFEKDSVGSIITDFIEAVLCQKHQPSPKK